MKTQASGYPSNVTTHEQKNEYIRQYEKHEGVHLDPNKIENNPGLHSIGKFFLWKIWSKNAYEKSSIYTPIQETIQYSYGCNKSC